MYFRCNDSEVLKHCVGCLYEKSNVKVRLEFCTQLLQLQKCSFKKMLATASSCSRENPAVQKNSEPLGSGVTSFCWTSSSQLSSLPCRLWNILQALKFIYFDALLRIVTMMAEKSRLAQHFKIIFALIDLKPATGRAVGRLSGDEK